jgi:flagellin-specific chaperone FliS
MSEYYKVEGHTSLLRDSESSAIVSTDVSAWRLHKLRKDNYKKQVDEINNIKDDMRDIKDMLNQLVEKING